MIFMGTSWEDSTNPSDFGEPTLFWCTCQLVLEKEYISLQLGTHNLVLHESWVKPPGF
jgi:hypothetical protein